MNEKKAIVFFFVVVVFFFCFSFLLLWWWLLLRRTSRTSFSRSSCVLVVSVCSSSPRRSLRSPARLFARMCVIVCVCVFQFPLFAAVIVFFFGGLTVSNAALLAHFVSSFSFLCCNSRGSLSPLFFHVSNKTRTHVHTYRHGHTDGRTEGEKCARAASFGKHTQNYFAFFIVVCYCYYYDWLLLLFTFHGMLLGVINKQRQSALHAHTLVRGWGELFTIFQLFRDALFGNLLLRLRRLPLLP